MSHFIDAEFVVVCNSMDGGILSISHYAVGGVHVVYMVTSSQLPTSQMVRLLRLANSRMVNYSWTISLTSSSLWLATTGHSAHRVLLTVYNWTSCNNLSGCDYADGEWQLYFQNLTFSIFKRKKCLLFGDKVVEFLPMQNVFKEVKSFFVLLYFFIQLTHSPDIGLKQQFSYEHRSQVTSNLVTCKAWVCGLGNR